jgi:hypothetical protein
MMSSTNKPRLKYKFGLNIRNYQYSETNVMHFLISLLRIKYLYIFRELLAHPQEVFHKRHLVYCVHHFGTAN